MGLTITLENGQLMSQANGEDKFSVAPKSDSVFWVDAYGASMTFVKNKNGEVDTLRYKGIQAKRIIPWLPDPKKFAEYSGIYYSDELFTQFKIDQVGGKLFMHHMR